MEGILQKLERIEHMLDVTSDANIEVPSYRGAVLGPASQYDASHIVKTKVPVNLEFQREIDVLSKQLPNVSSSRTKGYFKFPFESLKDWEARKQSQQPLQKKNGDKLYYFTNGGMNDPYTQSQMDGPPELNPFVKGVLMGDNNVCKVLPSDHHSDLKYVSIDCGAKGHAKHAKNTSIARKILALEHPHNEHVHTERIRQLYEVVQPFIDSSPLFRKFCMIHNPEINLANYSCFELIKIASLFTVFISLHKEEMAKLVNNDALRASKSMSDLADLSHPVLAFLGSESNTDVSCNEIWSTELAFLGFYCYDKNQFMHNHLFGEASSSGGGFFTGLFGNGEQDYSDQNRKRMDMLLAEYYRQNWACDADSTSNPKRLAMFYWLKLFISKLIIENPTTIGVLYNRFCAAGNLSGFNPMEIAPYLGFFVYIMGLASSEDNVFPEIEEKASAEDLFIEEAKWFIKGLPNDKYKEKYTELGFVYLSSSDIDNLRPNFPGETYKLLFRSGPGWYYTEGGNMSDVSIEDAFTRFGNQLSIT